MCPKLNFTVKKGSLFRPLCVNSTFFVFMWAKKLKDCSVLRAVRTVSSVWYLKSSRVCAWLFLCSQCTVGTFYDQTSYCSCTFNYGLFLGRYTFTVGVMPWAKPLHFSFYCFSFLLWTLAGYSNNGWVCNKRGGGGNWTRSFCSRNNAISLVNVKTNARNLLIFRHRSLFSRTDAQPQNSFLWKDGQYIYFFPSEHASPFMRKLCLVIAYWFRCSW